MVGQSGKEIYIRDQLACNWEDLLLLLEFEPASSAQNLMKTIERNSRGEVSDACREVLLKWISGQPSNCQPVTWRTLISVIEKLDNAVLARDLEEELSS